MGRKAERRRARARKEEAAVARRATRRALWRLDVLEYLILFLALILALLGGVMVAWVLSTAASFPFRPTWAVASLLLFIVPGGSVYLRELRRGRKTLGSDVKSEPKDPNG